MRMKHLMIAALLLAIITMGAVSATQDAACDNLTADDDNGDALSLDSDDVLANDESGGSDFGPDDVAVKVMDDIALPYTPETIVAEIDAPKNAKGNVSVYFNGNDTDPLFNDELQNIPYYIGDTDNPDVYTHYLQLNFLNPYPDAGSYHINVTYTGDDYYAAAENDGDVEITDDIGTAEVLYYGIYVPKFVLAGDEDADYYIDMNGLGHFYVYLDGNLMAYVKDDDTYYGYFNGLDLSEGIHTLKLVYKGNSYYGPVEEERNFTYGKMFFYVPDEVLMGYGDEYYETSMQLWLPSLEGNLTVCIDGKLFKNGTVSDFGDYEDEGCLSFDLTDAGLDFGKHNYAITYTDGDYDKTENGTFALSYMFAVAMESDPNTYFGDDVEFSALLPKALIGTIRVEYNNKTVNWNRSETPHFHISDLPLGENIITFTFMGENCPEKSYVCYVSVGTRIAVPFSFHFGGDELISLILPEDAQGNLTVYDMGDVKIIKTAELVNGRANLTLCDIPFGEYSINVTYTGGDYEVSDVSRDITVGPKVIYDEYLWTAGNYAITVISPDDVGGNLTVKIVLDEYWDEGIQENVVERMTIYEGPSNGTVVIGMPVDKLNAKDYRIEVGYSEDGSSIVGEYFDIHVYDTNPDWKMNATFKKEINKYQTYDEEMPALWTINNIPQHLNAIYYVYIDGELLYDYKINCDEGGYEPTLSGSVDVSKLSLGTHNITVKVIPNAYYANSSAEATFEVTWIEIPDVIAEGEYITFDIYDESAYGGITLKIDGEDYGIEFVRWGRSAIKITGLELGEHTYEIEYSGDRAHEKLTKNGTFTAGQHFYFINIEDGDVIPLYSYYPVFVRISDNSTGNITVTVGNLSQTKAIVNGSADFNFTGLGEGDYTVTAAYSGDGKYPAREISCGFTISGYEIVDDGDEDDLYYVLVLPGEAEGNLTAYYVYWDSDISDTVRTFLRTAELENGKAVIYRSELIEKVGYGYNDIEIRYEGNYSDINCFYTYIINDANVSIADSLTIGQDATIQIDLDGAEGNVTIILNGEVYDTVELVDGKINVTIPAAHLVQENRVIFEYVGENITSPVFMDFDVNSEEYEPHVYYIGVDVKDIWIPKTLDSNGTGNITLELPDDFSGNVTVYVNGTLVSTTPVGGGNVTIPLSNVSRGNSMVRVDVTGDDGSSYTYCGEVYVPKPLPTVEISFIIEGNTTRTVITFSENVTGAVIIREGYTGKDDVNFIEPDFKMYLFDLKRCVSYDNKNTFHSLQLGQHITVETDFIDSSTSTATYELYHFGGVKVEQVPYTPPAIIKGDNGGYSTTPASFEPLVNSVSVGDIVVGDDALVAVTTTDNQFSGNVVVKLGTVEVNVPVTASQGNATVSGLDVGDYPIYVQDPNIGLGFVIYGTFTVSPKPAVQVDPSLDIRINNITAGDDAVVVITTNETFSGIVRVQIDAVTVNVTVTAGYGNATVSGLAAGNYTAVATFDATDNFTQSVKNATFSVYVKPAVKADPSLDIRIGNITAGDDAVVVITTNETFSGIVSVQIDVVTVNVTVTAGYGNATVSGLAAGNYTAVATFDATDNFTQSVKNATFTVAAKQDVPSNPTGKVQSKITANDLTAYYSNVKYSVKVYGTDGKVAKNVQVVFKVNGKKAGTAKTNDKGIATIKLNQVPKTYKITSEALGKSVTKKLTVLNVVSLKKTKVKKSAKKLVIKATLKAGKKPLSGKMVTFKFNGKKFKAVKTNKNGVAKITVKKSALKKLKVGKKVKYQATYMKVTAKKSVKVKK